jgi:putative addiction module CopG family antidote
MSINLTSEQKRLIETKLQSGKYHSVEEVLDVALRLLDEYDRADSELAQQESELIKPEQSYPVWSPYDAIEAADTMLKVLHTAKTQDCA